MSEKPSDILDSIICDNILFYLETKKTVTTVFQVQYPVLVNMLTKVSEGSRAEIESKIEQLTRLYEKYT